MAILGFSLMAMAIFLLDLWIKNHIEQSRKEGEETAVCGDRLLIRRYHNKGAMLDAGADRSSLVAALSVALTLGLTVLFAHSNRECSAETSRISVQTGSILSPGPGCGRMIR